MRFLIGLLLGFAAGLAGAILFAPERAKPRESVWAEPGQEEPERIGSENGTNMAGLRRLLHDFELRLKEAWAEANEAAGEAEKDMLDRYQRASRRGR